MANHPLLERAHQQHRSGNLTEAAKNYRKFLKKEPTHPGALYLLGCLEYQRAHNDTATDLLLEAVTLAPHQPDYHNALGLALTALNNFPDADRSFHRALQLENRATFHTNLALLRKKESRLPDAITSLRTALTLQPNDTELLCEIGDLLQETRNFADASATYQQVLTLDPHLARAWYALGCAQNSQLEYVPAAKSFQSALDLKPDWSEARHNLARALYEIGQVSQAWIHFEKCHLPQSRAMAAIIVPGVPEADNQAVLTTRRNWASQDLPEPLSPPIRKKEGGDRLRLGYVSSFFHRDNWMKPIWGLINNHNRDAFHVTLFSDCAASQIKHGFRPHLKDRFFNTTTLPNDGLAKLIREAEIDILIDLNGYSDMRRLPLYTLRPAPVIIGWFNMYATTGMSCFDYLIGDDQVIPPSEEIFYSEKILRVPGTSYLTFSVDYPVPDVSPAPHLTNGYTTYGSLASQYKLTPEVIATWARILQATPSSKLLLKNKHLASLTTQQYLRDHFSQHAITPDRLLLEGPDDHFVFLKAYDRIDIALDPFPYNGGTTTSEALWQGVPVITFHGDRWASRTSASILHAADLPVAPNLARYIDLATSSDDLLALRPAMREKLLSSPVCDTPTFTHQMESLYQKVR